MGAPHRSQERSLALAIDNPIDPYNPQEGRVKGGQTSGREQAEQEGAGMASRIPQEKKVEGGQTSGQSRGSSST